MNNFKKAATALQDLIFPPLCACCQKALSEKEEILCSVCVLKLPKTNFHLINKNPVFEKFKGRITLRQASSFLFFTQESSVQSLIHQLKYHRKTQIGTYLGKIFAESLSQNNWLRDIDYIIPIPLHPKKKKRRGYNQSSFIAKGIALKSNIKIIEEDTVIKIKNTESQTKKSGLERLNNVTGVFRLARPKVVSEKSILLVDDVLTTGATLESCALEVLKGHPKSISIATLAYATDI